MREFTSDQNDGKHVFVFGSNLAGVHGAGAARTAQEDWGAKRGVGTGMTGNAYAIATKDRQLKTVPLSLIEAQVKSFLRHAAANPDKTFLVTAIGTGLAGYQHENIAPMFRNAPANCVLPEEWAMFTSPE